MVPYGGVTGYGLHDPNLSRPHVEREVLVMSRGPDISHYYRAPDGREDEDIRLPGEDEEDGVADQSHAVLHADYHLLPHPLGHQIVAQQDHHWPGNEPDGEESQEGIIESTLKFNINPH